MKTTLYELTSKYRTIESMLDNEFITGEEIQASLDNIKEQIGDKVESIAKIILSLKGDVKSVEAETERLVKRTQGMNNHIEWLKNYLLTEMISSNTYKVKRDLVTVSVADNPPSVEVVNLDLIPTEYRRVIPETWQPDKKAMIEHFRETGEIIVGTDLVLNKKHINIR